jgi:GNAT superfamily N-acetyltransferase
MADWLAPLIETEARFFSNVATLEKTDAAWFLHNTELADYRSANHALRLRDDGRGPEAVARDIVTFYRRLGLPPTADVDEIAEQQGIGAALRRIGVGPILGDSLYMVYTHATPPTPDKPPIPSLTVENISREIFSDATQQWIDLVASEEAGTEYEEFWREVITREAQGEGRQLYLARLQGQAVGACHLYTANGWGRIDDVFVPPEFRRLGVATALIVRAVADSLMIGNAETYLFTEAGGMAEPLYRKLGFTIRALNPLRRHIAS